VDQPNSQGLHHEYNKHKVPIFAAFILESTKISFERRSIPKSSSYSQVR